jgi:hypothetical protein
VGGDEGDGREAVGGPHRGDPRGANGARQPDGGRVMQQAKEMTEIAMIRRGCRCLSFAGEAVRGVIVMYENRFAPGIVGPNVAPV